MTRVRTRHLALVALLGCAAAACRHAPERVAAAPCAAVGGTLPAGQHAATLAGEFTLTLVATQGPRAGSAIAGRLRLRASNDVPAPTNDVRYPLYGTAGIALDAVGAVASGKLDATDPAAPGVLVIEWVRAASPTPVSEITLRFGADANRRSMTPFDGAYMALFIGAMSSERFTGRWQSGAGGAAAEAAGHFCAIRTFG